MPLQTSPIRYPNLPDSEHADLVDQHDEPEHEEERHPNVHPRPGGHLPGAARCGDPMGLPVPVRVLNHRVACVLGSVVLGREVGRDVTVLLVRGV